MKKSILTLAMMIIASCAFAQSADYLIKQYRKAKGADYENMTKKIKKQAKKERYINPKNYDLSKRISKAEYLTVELSTDNREVLTTSLAKWRSYASIPLSTLMQATRRCLSM